MTILCVAVVAANAQSFEGKIVYKNSFKVPNGGDAGGRTVCKHAW